MTSVQASIQATAALTTCESYRIRISHLALLCDQSLRSTVGLVDGYRQEQTKEPQWLHQVQGETSQGKPAKHVCALTCFIKQNFQCDETRPICERCKRSEKECTYEGSNRDRTPWSRKCSVLDQPDVGNFDSLDLLMMHHYITSTARNLVGPEEAKNLWQQVPLDAYAHPLLMHGILALAGIDMARKYASTIDHPPGSEGHTLCNKYRARALSHQHKGLRLFQRSLDSKLELPQADIPPLILFNLVLIMSTFALPFTDDQGEISIEDLLSIFALCRGGTEVYRSLRDANMKQPFAAMMYVRDRSPRQRFSAPAMHDIDACMASQERDVNRVALEQLINSQQFWQESTLDIRFPCHWPSMCSNAFVEEVRQLKPDSLAVLAQYSHVLNMSSSHWWIGNWSEMLLRAVDRCLTAEGKLEIGWDLAQNLASLSPDGCNGLETS